VSLVLALCAVARAEPGSLEADRVVLTPEELAATDGRWASDGWHLDFDEALIAEGQIVVSGARLTGCETDPPAWALRADEVTWRSDRLVVRGGVLELGGRGVVPVPWLSLPTEPRAVQPHVPELGYGDDGLRVVAPLAVRAGRASWQLSPGVRTRRGPQLGAAVALPSGDVEALGAWQGLADGALRGMVQADLGVAGPGWQAATLGALASDGEVLGDFALDALGRSTPWLEQRALAGVGALSAHVLGWQQDGVITARPGTALAVPVVELGPMRGDAAVSLHAVDGMARLWSRVGLEDVRRLGPVETTARAEARSLTYGTEQAIDGLLETTVLAPLWAEHGTWVHELAVGARGATGARLGELTPRVPDDLAPVGPSAGPWVESRWWRRGASVTAAGGLVTDGAGWAGEGRVRARSGPVAVDMQAVSDGSATLVGGRVGYDDQVVDLGVTSWHADGLISVEQIGVDAAVDVVRERGVWTPRGEVLAAPDALQAWRVGIGWASPCGCMELGAEGGFDLDQEAPQVLAWFDLLR